MRQPGGAVRLRCDCEKAKRGWANKGVRLPHPILRLPAGKGAAAAHGRTVVGGGRMAVGAVVVVTSSVGGGFGSFWCVWLFLEVLRSYSEGVQGRSDWQEIESPFDDVSKNLFTFRGRCPRSPARGTAPLTLAR